MFDKLHLLSQDAPESGGGLRWRSHPYLRIAGAVPRGPAVFEWNERQRADLEALWRHPAAEGARERLARDLAAFCDKLGWTPDAETLQDAEKHGDEYLITLSAVPPELYILPWEVTHVGASDTYLSDYACTQVRYAVPGLEPRELHGAPPQPGVLFAWSGAGGAVPHEDQAAAIRAACEAGGVTFRALPNVDEGSLQAALDAGPPSVLHLLCHGLPGPEGEPPRLKCGASDNPSELTATRLARMLRHHRGTIRLVVLSACGSGDGRGDPLFMGSTAQELHKKGIPNVVASRYPLSVPGSRVMTRALYDKMLREAWSLERSLRHTREALLRVDDDGESHAGDAYGIQLYACDTERFRTDDDTFAERPVLASYPFGTAARPVPTSAPPAAELTLDLDADPALGEDQLADRLRHVSEDDSLTIAIASHARTAVSLIVRTTVDGAQRLLSARRSKVLQVAVGVIVGELIMTKGIPSAMASTAPAAGTADAASKAGHQAASSQAGAAPAQAAASAGKLLAAKLVVAAGIGSAAIAGGVAVYRSQTPSSAPTALVAEHQPAAAPPAPSPPPSVVAEPAPAPSPPADAAADDVRARATVEGPPDAAPPDAARRPAARPDAARRGATPPDAAPPDAGPSDAAPPDAAPPDAASGPSLVGRGPTAVCGNGTVEAGELCDDGNTVDGDDCSSDCRTESVMVNYKDLNRISGKTQLEPPAETRNRMILDGATKVRAVVKLCIATTGSVTQAKLVTSTGYTAYDQILLASVRDWRYHAYTRNGTPAPACSAVTFVYAVK